MTAALAASHMTTALAASHMTTALAASHMAAALAAEHVPAAAVGVKSVVLAVDCNVSAGHVYDQCLNAFIALADLEGSIGNID